MSHSPSSLGLWPQDPPAPSTKARRCPFCREIGIEDGASRISDIRRHFSTKHLPAANQFCCRINGCGRIFDRQPAFEGHVKRFHRVPRRDLAFWSKAALVGCRKQLVFACGAESCRKVFEVTANRDAKSTAKAYFHHVASHFGDSETIDDWNYTRRVRNLLCQSRVRDSWKSSKERRPRLLQWQHHSSAELRKRLEFGDVDDAQEIVQQAISLASPSPGHLPPQPQPQHSSFARDGDTGIQDGSPNSSSPSPDHGAAYSWYTGPNHGAGCSSYPSPTPFLSPISEISGSERRGRLSAHFGAVM